MTPQEFLDLLNSGGVIVLLLAILYGGWKREPWWVFGREYRTLVAESSSWKTLALQGTRLASEAVTTAGVAVRSSEPSS